MKKPIGISPVTLCPVFIVGTYDDQDRPNLMNVAWGGVCCSQPVCLNISLRKATYSYAALVRRGEFTVNIPSRGRVREADYVGIYSGRDENKFEQLGLTPIPGEKVHAPTVGEFPLVIECRVLHTIEIVLHTQFIGEIVHVEC